MHVNTCLAAWAVCLLVLDRVQATVAVSVGRGRGGRTEEGVVVVRWQG